MSTQEKKIEPISFEEFAQICEEAGIAVPDSEQMETDYRVGRALADLAEELCMDTEGVPNMASVDEGYGVVTEAVEGLGKACAGKDTDEMRRAAVIVAARAIRFVSDVCHDEPGQN